MAHSCVSSRLRAGTVLSGVSGMDVEGSLSILSAMSLSSIWIFIILKSFLYYNDSSKYKSEFEDFVFLFGNGRSVFLSFASENSLTFHFFVKIQVFVSVGSKT